MTYRVTMIDIREATAADATAAVGLEARLFVEDAGVHDPHADVTWPSREGAADFAALVDGEESTVLLAWDGEVAVGLLMAYIAASGSTRQPIRSAVLRTMYVAESYRRHGVGGALIERFVEWARDAGCAEAHVNHFAANAPAGALYGRHGFEPRSLERVLSLD